LTGHIPTNGCRVIILLPSSPISIGLQDLLLLLLKHKVHSHSHTSVVRFIRLSPLTITICHIFSLGKWTLIFWINDRQNWMNNNRIGGTLELPFKGHKGTMDSCNLVEFKHSSKLVEQGNLRVLVCTHIIEPKTVPTKSTSGNRSTISRDRSISFKRSIGFH